MSGTPLKQDDEFKYLRAILTNDGRQETELSARIAKADAAMHQKKRGHYKIQTCFIQFSVHADPYIWVGILRNN